MRLFKRRGRDDEPGDPEERSPQLGLKFKDLAMMGQLMNAGADLAVPRHVVYYCYAPDAASARAMAAAATARGFSVEVRDPLPAYPDQWAVVSETKAALSPDFVRGTTDFFETLAAEHGAEYDGWEAAR